MAIEVQLSAAPVAWHLDSPAGLLTAAQELADKGYRGELAFWHTLVDGVPTGEVVWSLEVNAEQGIAQPVKATVGDYLLLASGILQRLSADEFSGMTA